MKRIPKQVKLLDIIATLLDWIFIAIALFVVYRLFSILQVPTVISDVIITDYDIFGLTLSTSEVNLTISLLMFYLIVFVPTAFVNTKRLRSKDLVDIDEWTYRTQFLYMFMSFFTFNIPSAVLRYLVGIKIKVIYDGKAFKATMKDIWTSIKLIFNAEARALRKQKRALRKGMSDSQQDLERVTKIEFGKTVMRLVLSHSTG
jgi:hypothetical protein